MGNQRNSDQDSDTRRRKIQARRIQKKGTEFRAMVFQVLDLITSSGSKPRWWVTYRQSNQHELHVEKFDFLLTTSNGNFNREFKIKLKTSLRGKQDFIEKYGGQVPDVFVVVVSPRYIHQESVVNGIIAALGNSLR